MAAELHFLDQRRLIDSNGIAAASDIYFYLTGTLTPATVYTDDGLTTPHPSPITVDAGAAVPDIYLDSAVTYRRRIVYADGSVDDIDPYRPPVDPQTTGRAALRADLALASTIRPVLLSESGREGLFIFDSADHSAHVTADARQGIYVAPTSDPTGASGAWVRNFVGPMEVDWFGPDGVDDTVAIHAARDLANTLGTKHVRVSTSLACATQVLFDKDDQEWDFKAPISNSFVTGAGFFVTGARVTLNTPQFALTDTGSGNYFNVTGTDATIINPKLTRTATAGVAFYVQGPNCHIIGGSSDWYGGYICDGASGFQLVGHTITNSGGDDNIALKAVNGSTDGVLIANNTFNGGAGMVSFGSELGTLGANDSTHSKYVRNVQVLGNKGNGCSNIIYIKPGAVEAYDYRDGLVEHVVCSDNILEDSTGALFNRGVAITVGRGTIVRHVTGKNNQVRARALNSGVTLVGAIHIIAQDFRAVSPTSSAPTIDHIDVQVLFNDPYDGVASGGSAPGEPVSSIAFVEKDTVGWGTVSNVTIDVTGNGCVSSGIIVGSDLDVSVFIRRAVLSNIGASGSANDCGIKTASRVKVGSEIYYTGTASRAYKIDSGGSIVANVDPVLASKDTAAGTDSTTRAVRWAAPRNCFVHKVEIVNSTNIAHSANDTDYTQHEIRNEDGASAVNSVNSALTGGVALPSGAFNAIYDAANLSGGSLADCFYTRGQRLSYTKNDFGTGNALTDAVLRIHWAPF
jgi:hypothetical protein